MSDLPPVITTRNEQTTPCPFCAEPIQAAARKCKHCGEFLDGQESKVLVEQTAKKYKAGQAIAAGGCLLGLILTFVGIGMARADGPLDDQTVAIGFMIFGGVVFAGSMIAFITVGIVAWWHHG